MISRDGRLKIVGIGGTLRENSTSPLAAAVFVSVLNSSMVNVAIPLIREDFGASEAQVGWVITGFLLLYAIGIPLYGRAADIFSLRRAFALGLVVFALGSLICIV